MIEAVIFDMDGVIVKTSMTHAIAESMVLAKVGINITPEDIIRTYSGFKDIEFLEDVLRRFSVQGDAQQLREEKWNIIYGELLPQGQGIPTISGVKEFIESLKSRYTLAIASSAPMRFIETVITKLGLKKNFTVITSGDEVQKGKPDPALFLLAAQKLHMPPEGCLIVEDAPSGIKAARAAGMKSIGITTTHKREELEGADRIIDDFMEISLNEIQSL